MRPTDKNSELSWTGSSIVLLAWLTLVIILVVGGAAYGIVQMQRGLDQMYRPFATGNSLASVQASDDTESAKLPAIIIVGNPTHGKELFNMSCYVCHGPTGTGVPALGANLRQSRFIRMHTDKQLITFIKMGRQPGDPNTVFNGTMPPKGGNPTLDDVGIQDVIAFVRTLQAVQAGIALPADSSTSSASTLR